MTGYFGSSKKTPITTCLSKMRQSIAAKAAPVDYQAVCSQTAQPWCRSGGVGADCCSSLTVRLDRQLWLSSLLQCLSTARGAACVTCFCKLG